eukprot:904901-Rhodomonas_salina.2
MLLVLKTRLEVTPSPSNHCIENCHAVSINCERYWDRRGQPPLLRQPSRHVGWLPGPRPEN